jgi:hypothetical protein
VDGADGAVEAPSLLRSLGRLVRAAGREVVLVLDRPPVHRSGAVRARPAGRGAGTEVFHLPPHGPGSDPDEGVDADLEQAVTREAPARSKRRLERALVGHRRRLSKPPHRVRSFFGHETFRCAARFKTPRPDQ